METTTQDTTDIGAHLLRIAGNQATKGDVRKFLQAWLDNPQIRERASALSSLTQDLEREERELMTRALIITLFANHQPGEEPPLDDKGETDQTKLVQTTPAFAAFCTPLPESPWSRHSYTKWKGKAVAEYTNVTPYTASIVRSLEQLWACAGHMLKT